MPNETVFAMLLIGEGRRYWRGAQSRLAVVIYEVVCS